MKKTIYYPTLWQTYPFSMEWFAHMEKEAIENEKAKKERKPKFKLALGW